MTRRATDSSYGEGANSALEQQAHPHSSDMPSHLAVRDRVGGRVLEVRHVAQHFTCPHTLVAGENRKRKEREM